MQEFSMAPEGNMDFALPDNASWDDIFASAGLNMEADLFLP